jgi:hypothetical protein
MMFAHSFLESTELELGPGRRDQVTLLGPSFWGAIYRSEKTPACYRLLPIEYASLEKRAVVREWSKRPRKRGVAPIVDAGQTSVRNRPFFYIQYEIKAERTWADIIADPAIDLSTHLGFAIRVLREFPRWRELIHDDPQQYLLPVPHDIVFVDTIPHLLALPFWGVREIDAIFAVPQRALYLPPEYVRGCDNDIWGHSVDLYAIGIAIFQCLFAIKQVDTVERLLSRIANGSLLSVQHLASRIPFWLEAIGVCENMIADVRRAVHPDVRVRSSVQPFELANQLEAYRKKMVPKTIVDSIVEAGKPREAFALLQDILLEQSSYELLLLAAEVAGNYLGRPLEAIDILEQAIVQRPGDSEAYEAQLKMILANPSDVKLAFGNQLDTRMRRDFQALPIVRQEEYEVEVAYYFLAQGQYRDTAEFIYPRLFLGDKYIWWKFGLAIAYTTAWMQMGELDAARQQMLDIKANLKKVRQNRALPFYEIQFYGLLVSELEVELLNRSAAER